MQKTIIVNDKTFTLIKKVSEKVVTDVCKWKELLESDLVCIESGVVYFYKSISYNEKIKNKNATPISS